MSGIDFTLILVAGVSVGATLTCRASLLLLRSRRRERAQIEPLLEQALRIVEQHESRLARQNQ